MARKRKSIYSEIGLKKKDLNEMAGCMAIIWPIVLLLMLFF